VNWAAIGAIGEIIGAVAVVLSLIHLAVQIRQNTQQIEGAMSHTAPEQPAWYEVVVHRVAKHDHSRCDDRIHVETRK